jgi:hypothetical protein
MVDLVDEHRHDVAWRKIEIIPPAIKIGWHCGDKVTAMLSAIGLSELDPAIFAIA